MAKSKSIFEIQGTFRGTTFVNSRTYGSHIRAARGSHKQAVVNDAFQKESEQLQSANVPAKMIKDALEPYREHFNGGLFWQRLVSHFSKQLKSFGKIDFSRIEPIEVHEKYPLSRFFGVYPTVHFDPTIECLRVSLDYGGHPKLKRMSYVDSYRIALIGIFPDLVTTSAVTTVALSPVLPLTSNYEPPAFDLAVPAGATSFVLCVRAEGCEKGKVCKTAVTKGMRIIGAGAIA